MSTVTGVRHYIDYFESRLSPENIFFYLEIEAFKKVKANEIAEHAKHVYELYFKHEGQLELNVTDELKYSLKTRIDNQDYSLDMFDKPQKEILYLMRSDFPYFLKSKHYEALLEDLEKEEYSSSKMIVTMLYMKLKNWLVRGSRIKVADWNILQYTKERVEEYLAGKKS